MATSALALRVAALEAEVAQMKEQLAKPTPVQGDWLDDIYGVFANDPIYEKAMKLGREYRESLRPGAAIKPARKAKKKVAEKRVD